ncbi:low-specificity threonine aldolase [Acetobacter estunensis NRIC 0472]|uniref:L-threonine aldolase n=1 Tax=Acetobacter estunensis TaxID=104097 RepID=A0A967B5I7_9PROT|nr:low specificity L-threonine aldolase [Acetobacter estunensis]MBV1837884.1 low specificity L-threonine aldolase [Acetobacter estunensis]NHO54177.1 low specificity L-threonine aldolase [Acetobacter estunensis]GBQ21429.1 low-specificity threonine aldolase [Acetobacter estunensis NRIC 0472]
MEQNTDGAQPHDRQSSPDGGSAEPIRTNFMSDNVGTVSPEILAALAQANVGEAPAHGADSWTRRLEARVAEVFEAEARVFPVATGTAANALALSALSPPWGAILCDESAHINRRECGAPEFFTGGAKLWPIPSADGRMEAGLLASAVADLSAGGARLSRPAALSLTQATEWGTVYTLEHLVELTALAHEAGLSVHMDGARFGNALAHLGCSPADMTWRAGVDVLSLGATKSGALSADLIVMFDLSLAEDMERRIKRSGHLWAKQRFLSAQLLAWLENDLWLRNARHANEMAGRLARGLARHPAATLPFDTQGNEVFAVLPELLVEGLEAAGFVFLRRTAPPGVTGTLVRFVTGHDTRPQDVDALLEALAGTTE